MKAEKQFAEVVGLIKEAQGRAFGAVNVELINTYWQVGEYISKRIAQAVWGEKNIEELAQFIESRHPDLKGYSSSRELERMISAGVYERVMMGNEKLPPSVKRERVDISGA